MSMVVFTDYRCPHCRAFERTVMPRLERAGQPGCGLSLTVVPVGMLGADSELTATGALCAARQGETRFSAFHKAMFDLPGVNQASLIDLAEKQGLERTALYGVPGRRFEAAQGGRGEHPPRQRDRHPRDAHRRRWQSRLRQPELGPAPRCCRCRTLK